MKTIERYRQGDVMFHRIARLPQGNQVKRPNGVLAEGEVTGHAHRVADLDQAEVLEIEGEPELMAAMLRESGLDATQFPDGRGLFLSVGPSGVSIRHEEHGAVDLPAGDYFVGIQREYTPEEIRNVVD